MNESSVPVHGHGYMHRDGLSFPMQYVPEEDEEQTKAATVRSPTDTDMASTVVETKAHAHSLSDTSASAGSYRHESIYNV